MNTYYVAGLPVTDELYHHGILGQKWGVRRYQNPDGSLTDEGMKRYNKSSNIQKDLNWLDKENAYLIGDMNKIAKKASKLERKGDRYLKKYPDDPKGKMKENTNRMREYTKQVKELGQKFDSNKKLKEGLQWAAIGRGMDITTKQIPRSTARLGERFAREGIAWGMAIGTSFVNPLGFGFGYGGSTGRTMGTKYKVRNNPEAQALLGNNVVNYNGNNNGTTYLRLDEKRR